MTPKRAYASSDMNACMSAILGCRRPPMMKFSYGRQDAIVVTLDADFHAWRPLPRGDPRSFDSEFRDCAHPEVVALVQRVLAGFEADLKRLSHHRQGIQDHVSPAADRPPRLQQGHNPLSPGLGAASAVPQWRPRLRATRPPGALAPINEGDLTESLSFVDRPDLARLPPSYLESLCPVKVPFENAGKLFAITADPTAAYLAVPGLLCDRGGSRPGQPANPPDGNSVRDGPVAARVSGRKPKLDPLQADGPKKEAEGAAQAMAPLGSTI